MKITKSRRKALGMTLFDVVVVVLIALAVAILLAELYKAGLFRTRKSYYIDSSPQYNRQIALAGIMYSGDNDDGLPLTTNGWLSRLQNRKPHELTINCPGPGTQDLPANDAAGARATLAWPITVRPYTRMREIFVDPSRSDPHGIWTTEPIAPGEKGYNPEGATLRNQSRFPMYGYNYMFLSPLRIPKDKRDRADAVNYAEGESHKTTQATDPGGTIFFVTSQRSPADPTRGFFVVNAPGMWPAFQNNKNGYVAFWSGTAGGGDWVGTKTACPDYESPCSSPMRSTGFAYLRQASHDDFHRPGNNATFLDGHVKYMTDEQLTAGTSYLTATAGSAGSLGSGAVITDKKKYLWDLDGNYYGQ